MESSYYISAIVPHVMTCTKELYSFMNESTYEEWIYVTHQAMYFIYPAVLILALIFTLLSTIVSAKMATDSHECYMTGFHVASFVMVLITIAMQIPNYVDMDFSMYTEVLAYLLPVENWCWYTCSWLLLTAVIERAGHAMCGRWHASFGRIHGIIASLLMVIICFVTSLPQYWEFQVTELTRKNNCSYWAIVPKNTILKPQGGYVPEYYYYNWVIMVFSIAIPYLVLPILVPAMCCVKMHLYSALSINGTISTYADDYHIKEDVKDERSFNRILGLIVFFYLLMSGPRNALKLLHNPPFFMSICESRLMADTLIILFDVAFYMLFIFLFFFLLCLSKKFRMSLKALRCACCGNCCCCGDADDD